MSCTKPTNKSSSSRSVTEAVKEFFKSKLGKGPKTKDIIQQSESQLDLKQDPSKVVNGVDSQNRNQEVLYKAIDQ